MLSLCIVYSLFSFASYFPLHSLHTRWLKATAWLHFSSTLREQPAFYACSCLFFNHFVPACADCVFLINNWSHCQEEIITESYILTQLDLKLIWGEFVFRYLWCLHWKPRAKDEYSLVWKHPVNSPYLRADKIWLENCSTENTYWIKEIRSQEGRYKLYAIISAFSCPIVVAKNVEAMVVLL